MVDNKVTIHKVVIAILLLLILIAMIWFIIMPGEKSPEVILAALMVLGVVALLLALSSTAIVFDSVGLSDSKQALGLPEGSMQAVIAFSLILIFMISSLFLFYQVEQWGRDKVFVYNNISQELLDDIPEEEIVAISPVQKNNETVFNVSRLVKISNETSEDLAKQIITTVSTLAVAVAGFYFGSKGASGNLVSEQKISFPVIRSIDPIKAKLGYDGDFKVYGKNFELATEVKLIRTSIEPILCSNITSSSTMINCKLKIPEKSTIGTWTVVVICSDSAEDRFEDAFTASET